MLCPRAGLAGRADLTRGPIKTDAHDRVAGNIPARGPSHTRLPLGTAGPVRLPIHHEGLEVIPLACQPWPAIRPKGGPDHINLTRCLGGDEALRIHIAAVEHVGAWQEITPGEVVVDGRAHHAILRRRWCRDHLGDQIRPVGVTGCGQVNLIADPIGLALTTVAGLQVVGRGDAPGRSAGDHMHPSHHRPDQ
jgi:hypothetical protein